MSKWCGDENCLQCADKEPDPYMHLPREEYVALREQNRVLREVVDYIKQRCEPFQHGGDHGLKLHGGILPARIVAALTATSQPGGTHEL